MANVFGILSALVLATTAFFAFKNKQALENQAYELSIQESDRDRQDKTFKELQAEAGALEDDAKKANDENTTLTAQLEKQLADNKEIQNNIDELKEVVEAKQTELETKRTQLAPLGDLGDLKNEFTQLKTDLATLNGELLQRDAELQSRTAANKSLETQNNGLKEVLSNYAQFKSNPNLKASISRVVSDVGFVILTGGDNAGIIRDSTLDVVRGGEVIGKLKVTATEPNSAAANIIPDSFIEGVSVRVGDTVVASKD